MRSMLGRITSLLALGTALAAAAAPARAAAPYADGVLADPALAGYWAFNERAGPVTADLRTTGEGVHAGGVRAGAPPLVPSGRSARYDGRHAATTVANTRLLNPTAALTVETWVDPDAVPHAATLAGKRGQYALGFDRTGRAVFRLWSGGVQHRLASEPGAVAAGRIIHLAGTFDGQTQRLYVDGAERATAALGARLDKTPGPLVLGGGLRGRLDDVALYASALDAATLAAHDAAGRAPACPDDGVWTGVGAAWRAACWRPYLDGSPFNQPLRPGAPLAPRSAAVVARLAGQGAPQMIYGLPAATSDPAFEPADFQHPVYLASWSDRASRVVCVRIACPELRHAGVPVPPGVRPAQAGDGHLAVMDEDSGDEYDLWQVGGAHRRARPSLRGDGRAIRASAGGVTRPGEGLDYGLGSDATAAHFGLAAGIVRAPELMSGEIDHALFLLVDCTRGEVAPARGLGSRCADARGAPAMGQRLRLDYSDAEIDALDAPAWKKAVLRALAHYGGYVGDTGSASDAAFEVALESGETYTSLGAPDFLGDFWAQVDGTADDRYRNYRYFDLGSGVDWRRLQVVDPCVAARTC
jgi:hypothetical protein